jgi:hypothetical protein
MGTAINLETRAATTAIVSEFLTAKVAVQKMSIPLESVPRKFVVEGGRSLGCAPHVTGSSGEKKDRRAKKTRITMTVKLNLKRLSWKRSLKVFMVTAP